MKLTKTESEAMILFRHHFSLSINTEQFYFFFFSICSVEQFHVNFPFLCDCSGLLLEQENAKYRSEKRQIRKKYKKKKKKRLRTTQL